MLKELKKNKMSVVATGILFGVMGVLIIPMIAVIVKTSNALSQKHPRIYKYSMIAFIGMLLAISLFCVVIKHQMSFLVIVADVYKRQPQWGVQAIERSCDSKMEGLRPDKFAFAKRSEAMKAPVGLSSDRTVLR